MAASVTYTYAAKLILDGTIDFDTGGDTFDVLLVDTTSTAPTDYGANFISEFGTLGEYDDTNNPQGWANRLTLAGQATSEINATDATGYGAVDFTDRRIPNAGNFAGGATNDLAGVVIYKSVTSDADSIPICFIPFTGAEPTSADYITIVFHANGGVSLG